MFTRSLLLASFLVIVRAVPASGQGLSLTQLQKEPLLRVEAGGPMAFVTTLAFSPDGTRLYAAGFDKVVRVWVRGKGGTFQPSPTAYRVPLGPGTDGTINAIDVS